ncbi:MAG: SAM-dependent methyltransferase [Asticcacaulis sp.]|uniref:SAM-dependent methyltransferase n=1 Tax=Asticcacaulis sp. TaxID=1872648 RepID=UPI003F7CA698
MSLLVSAAERTPLPNAITLGAIDLLTGQTRKALQKAGTDEAAFVSAMRDYPIAAHADAANRQHYELPPEFFAHILGPHRKYSCCLYPHKDATLAEAEAHALSETCAHADLRDGQSVLELGCGWGSLSLWMAAHYPNSRIISVSNSAPQRAFILSEAQKRGLDNLSVVTADMNDFTTDQRFDRIVSVEMFEHMSNWRALLERARGWLKADGRLFLHVFVSTMGSYRFDHTDRNDWIAQYFFTGGVMPAQDLPHRFPDLFAVEDEWRWSGTQYRLTALDWLKNYDSRMDAIRPILRKVYGADAELWRRRWRLFFLATAGLFGHDKGRAWQVGHYRLKPVQQ